MTILGFNPDATAEVLAENQFNDPPDEGKRFVIVRIRGTNVGADEPEDFDPGFSARLVGSRNIAYTTFEESCGVIPDSFSSKSTELFRGGIIEGNICFQVGADETGFVLFWEPFLEERLVWFSVE